MYLYIMTPYKTKFEMLCNWNQSYIFKKLTDNGIVAIFPIKQHLPIPHLYQKVFLPQISP